MKIPIVLISLQVQSSFQAVPLGAASIVSALKNDRFITDRCTVSLCDLSLEDPQFHDKDDEGIARIIADRVFECACLSAGCDTQAVFGFSIYVWNRQVCEKAARIIRQRMSKALVLAGGPEITANPLFADTPFHYLIQGEGETASTKLISSYLDLSVAACESGTIIRATHESLDSLSSPWLDGTLLSSPSVNGFHGALWELARGCPYSCSYCYESKGSKQLRYFPLSRLSAELHEFVRMGIERVFVLDPTYNCSRERALQILALIEKIAPTIHFNFEVRCELLDREIVRAFSRIPCSLQIGLQSSNPRALAAVSRPTDIKAFTKKIGLLNEAGIVFGLDLICGLPEDSLSTFRSSIDFALSLYPNNLELFRLAVLPGTTLHDQAASFSLRHQDTPPYHVLSLPSFPAADIDRAMELARAVEFFYTHGRAVSWFLAVIYPLKIKSSRFFSDFAAFLQRQYPAMPLDQVAHQDIEAIQLAFLELVYQEKGLSWAWPVVKDLVSLNGAWTRALADGESSILDLSYDSEDIMGPDALDILSFAENAYMEASTVHITPGPDGPELH
ncbi:MAG: radical SAM protein [Spirochaetales bacterium]|nr:radical SAM protein [Spirochaetales bacterium]